MGLGPAGYTLGALSRSTRASAVVGGRRPEDRAAARRVDRSHRRGRRRRQGREPAAPHATTCNELKELVDVLDERGRCSASAACREYGITVRWDKSFLSDARTSTSLRRPEHFRAVRRCALRRHHLDIDGRVGRSASTTSPSRRARVKPNRRIACPTAWRAACGKASDFLMALAAVGRVPARRRSRTFSYGCPWSSSAAGLTGDRHGDRGARVLRRCRSRRSLARFEALVHRARRSDAVRALLRRRGSSRCSTSMLAHGRASLRTERERAAVRASRGTAAARRSWTAGAACKHRLPQAASSTRRPIA